MGDNDIKSLLNDYLNDLNSIGVKVAKVIDIKVQYIAFIGYVFANLTRNEYFLLDEEKNKVKLKSCFKQLKNHFNQIAVDLESKSEIEEALTKRLNCFLLYLDNKYSYEKLQSEIKKYSVTKALDKYNNRKK